MTEVNGDSTAANNVNPQKKERKRHGARNQHKTKHFLRWLSVTFPDALEHAHLSNNKHVLDVAGGKGELAARLCMCSLKRVVLVDPRPANVAACFLSRVLPQIPKKWQQNIRLQMDSKPSFVEETLRDRFRQIVGIFDENAVDTDRDLQEAIEGASLLVGLHADGATEAIVDVALERNKPFVVVPCCVFPNLFQQRTVVENGQIRPVRNHEQFCQYLLEKDSRLKRAVLPFEGRNVAIYFTGG